VIIILSLDAPKSSRETEKTLKTLSSGQKNLKKTQKNPPPKKKTTGLVFFFKTRVFSNPACYGSSLGPNPDISQNYKSGKQKPYKNFSPRLH
jgi:hypothetical protein